MKAHWIALACCLGLPALAAAEHPLLPGYAAQARQADPAFAGFSAERGRALYFSEAQREGTAMSCASCHTADPRQAGKTPARRRVEPLAPVANPKRLSDAQKVEKWFRRNCDDVFARECTAREKGDFITWLDSLK